MPGTGQRVLHRRPPYLFPGGSVFLSNKPLLPEGFTVRACSGLSTAAANPLPPTTNRRRSRVSAVGATHSRHPVVVTKVSAAEDPIRVWRNTKRSRNALHLYLPISRLQSFLFSFIHVIEISSYHIVRDIAKQEGKGGLNLKRDTDCDVYPDKERARSQSKSSSP